MPRLADLRRVLILGTGASVAHGRDELDRAGAEVCRALLEEGCEVVAVTSGPSTSLTDPALATRTYIEPLDVTTLTRVIEIERPDALLPTCGGPAALRLAADLQDAGTLERFAVRLIGAGETAIRAAEDRALLRAAAEEPGLNGPRGSLAAGLDGTVEERLGQTGASRAPLEESHAGWQRFEIEVVRDGRGNGAVVCSIEHIDPMGVHAGAGALVAPALTLSDSQYQDLRDAALVMAGRLDIVGGGTVELAVHPETGVVAVVGVKPGHSTSSAFAAAATGFPIAATAARLALGYTLDEIAGVAGGMPAGLEPALDHIAVAMPRRVPEGATETGERTGPPAGRGGHVMAIGRTFKEAFLKALRSRHHEAPAAVPAERGALRSALATLCTERCELVLQAFRQGMEIGELRDLTGMQLFFLSEMRDIVELEGAVRGAAQLTPDLLLRYKRFGFPDKRIGELTGRSEGEVRALRLDAGVVPAYRPVCPRCVDSAGGFVPWFSTYGEEGEAPAACAERVVVLGPGVTGVGPGVGIQGGCAAAAAAARDLGWEVIVADCGLGSAPAAGDTPGRLYVEPLTLEDVANIVAVERPAGVVVQFAGRESLGIARAVAASGTPVLGTSPEDLVLAGDRDGMRRLLGRLGIRSLGYGTAVTPAEAEACAERLGYPLVVRRAPASGGRPPQIVRDPRELGSCVSTAGMRRGTPAIIEEFLQGAVEVGVDAVSDGEDVFIGGVLQYIDETGRAPWDSACIAPPLSLGETVLEEVRRQTTLLARELRVRGLFGVRFSCHDGGLTLVEANPWGSCTMPLVSCATGVPMMRLAMRVMLGEALAELPPSSRESRTVSAIPFVRLPDTDAGCDAEAPPVGEVAGIGETLPAAFAKAAAASGAPLPQGGGAFVSVRDDDKAAATILARRLHDLGFTIFATSGTGASLTRLGIPAQVLGGASRGESQAVDLIARGEIALVIHIPSGGGARSDAPLIRTAARRAQVPVITTLAAAAVAIAAIGAAACERIDARCLQVLQRPAEQE